MAHFAQVSDSGYVTQVIVVSNADTLDADGNESEGVGIAFCKSLFGESTNWVQTSYHAKFRGCYAGAGYYYDRAKDVFVPPHPEPA